MNLKNLFLTDVAIFESSHREIENRFYLDATLPDQVFRDGFESFAFEAFDWVMGAKFWRVIQKLANVSGDGSLLLAVLDPDPSSYYKKEFGYYNWANIPVSFSSHEYWNLINEYPNASPADCLLVNSEKVIWLPKSGKWAIWGERSYEVCVIGCRKEILSGSLNDLKDLEWALEAAVCYCFRDCIVPRDFAEKLRTNYGSSVQCR